MLRVREIESIDDPGLLPFLTLKRPEEHRRQGIFIAQGEKNVSRLLTSRCQIISLLATHDWLRRLEPLWSARSEDMEALIGEKRFIERIINHKMYQGVMAVARVPQTYSLDDIFKLIQPPYLIAAVEGLSNADNLGVLVRNAGAFGAQALLVGETSSSPYLRRAVRSSMGVIFDLPVVESASLRDTLAQLEFYGVRCFGAHARPEATSIYRADLRSSCCLVFGSEGHGLSEPILKLCRETIYIPMHPAVDSLNVGNAAAVFFYEVQRQRRDMLRDLAAVPDSKYSK